MADSTALPELTRNFLIIFNQRGKGTQATRGYHVLVLLLRELDCEIARASRLGKHQLIGNAYEVENPHSASPRTRQGRSVSARCLGSYAAISCFNPGQQISLIDQTLEDARRS